jgi:hypothetical protein
VSLWVLRTVLALHALAALAQPILIGGYFDGHFDLLSLHRANGSLVPLLALVGVGAAVGYAVAGRGRWHPAMALTLLVVLEGLQIGFGYNRALAVHLPLGVTIVGCAVVLAVWSFTSRARRVRPRKLPTRDAS